MADSMYTKDYKQPNCKDCDKHALGCKSECEAWQEYEKKYMEAHLRWNKDPQFEIFEYKEALHLKRLHDKTVTYKKRRNRNK